ncbi:class I SAM-dependent methyltransferase [Paramagnetospirillum magneticum]|uniref:SAM-dependent methyltransferase n=1 Tax=Paramagnetospirillum magneticum (strain ATCC 700264 / AMB-1) TaxID=342108 RepID=Q2WB57_PARM1|nr:class I SAM-dependent methyltransferase [Paramagnetospirillum magneticum]BAE48918.1 SAM-dependent methyltransferase [Paramagnetospirillum magneticum AMB-1]
MIDIGHLFVCPLCREGLTSSGDGYACTSCHRHFGKANGVWDFRVEPAAAEPPLYSDPFFRRHRECLAQLHAQHYGENSMSGQLEDRFKQVARKLMETEPDFVGDIGCGTGGAFSTFGPPSRMIGVDQDIKLLEVAARRYPEATLVCCDLLRSPLRQGAFPALICLCCLEHVYWLEDSLAVMHDLLAPGGRLYVMIPTEGGLAWSTARNLFTLSVNAKISGMTNDQYRHVMRIEHCNNFEAVNSALFKFFEIERFNFWPMGIGGHHLNLIGLYSLKRRTSQMMALASKS